MVWSWTLLILALSLKICAGDIEFPNNWPSMLNSSQHLLWKIFWSWTPTVTGSCANTMRRTKERLLKWEHSGFGSLVTLIVCSPIYCRPVHLFFARSPFAFVLCCVSLLSFPIVFVQVDHVHIKLDFYGFFQMQKAYEASIHQKTAKSGARSEGEQHVSPASARFLFFFFPPLFRMIPFLSFSLLHYLFLLFLIRSCLFFFWFLLLLFSSSKITGSFLSLYVFYTIPNLYRNMFTADIIVYDHGISVFVHVGDVTFFVTGGEQENEMVSLQLVSWPNLLFFRFV